MYDVIIIGSGPAGLTAAIYTTRDRLKTLVIAGTRWGGQLQLTTLIENFPGFPDGIQGPDLMLAMRKQAEHFGAEIIETDFSQGDFSPLRQGSAGRAKTPFKITARGKQYEGRSIIIATGTDTMWLGVPGEKEKIGHGVAACAPCDAPFFRNKNVIVVGGGNAAMEEALILANFAKEVRIVYRQESFKRASEVMVEKIKTIPNIKFVFNSEITEIMGEMKVEKVKLKNTKTGKVSEMPIDGIFVAISRKPNSEVFRDVEKDKDGFIIVHDQIKTNIEGVFVAGDVHNKAYQQAITAAGFGAMAALEARRWLDKNES
jgi:thioredoxin reductase (NADPH)